MHWGSITSSSAADLRLGPIYIFPTADWSKWAKNLKKRKRKTAKKLSSSSHRSYLFHWSSLFSLAKKKKTLTDSLGGALNGNTGADTSEVDICLTDLLKTTLFSQFLPFCTFVCFYGLLKEKRKPKKLTSLIYKLYYKLRRQHQKRP